MSRRKQITSNQIIGAVTIFCCVAMVFTWEIRSSISPMEKSIAHVIIPAQKGITYFGDWLVEQVNFVKSINELEALNKQLKEETDKLTYENNILVQDRFELERLRELFELDKRYADYPKVGARVIGKDPGNWYSVFLIDKGEEDGIEVNMVVMAGNGLVGRIVEVGPGYAKVRSIIDDASSVSAKILRTSDLCTVKGDKTLDKGGSCYVEYIQENVNVVVGDQIVTSHLGTIYPPGILIGEITSIEDESHKMSQNAILKPVVDFKHLEEVLVINVVWGN